MTVSTWFNTYSLLKKKVMKVSRDDVSQNYLNERHTPKEKKLLEFFFWWKLLIIFSRLLFKMIMMMREDRRRQREGERERRKETEIDGEEEDENSKRQVLRMIFYSRFNPNLVVTTKVYS
jgi:hypothetical protein